MTLFGKHPKTPDSSSQSPDLAVTTTSKASTSKPEEAATSIPAAVDVALPEPAIGKNEDLDMGKQIDGAFKAIGDADQDLQKYKDSKTLKLMNAAGTAINTAQTDVTTVQSYASTAKMVYDSDAMKTVREGVNMLVESLPGLVKALDEVAKLHPFTRSAFS